jgi:hypothetical protein
MISKPIIKFKGAVENSKLIMLNQEAFQKHLNTLKGEVAVTVERRKKNRTLPQNALYWLWLTYLEDATGQDKEDFHNFFKKRHLVRLVKFKGKAGKEITEKIVGSTTELDSFAFTEYLEKVQVEASELFGVNLPSPDDVYI